MDALQRIRELLDRYDWSVYKLSVKSGLPQSTLANMFARNNLPTIPTLEMICRGFGISMSEFFDYTEDESVKRIGKQLTIDNAYANNIIEHYDLTDVRTLYAFGEYVGKNEIETFKALAELDEDTIALMSSTFTEGFKRGFVV